MAGTHLLVADADLGVCEMLRDYLNTVGFEVVAVQDGVQCLSIFRSTRPELVLLDASLPIREGNAVLSALRSEYEGPVVLMMNVGDALDQVAAFEAGADDIVCKPLDLPVLAARLKAILRRTRKSGEPVVGDVIQYDNFEISRERFELKLGGVKVDIPPKELQLLYCLASNPNRVFSREQLLEHVWDFAFLGDSRTVDVHIKRLREKLKDASPKWSLSTVWGIGYKFELK